MDPSSGCPHPAPGAAGQGRSPSLPFYVFLPFMRLARWYQNRLAARGIEALLDFRRRSDWIADRLMPLPRGISCTDTRLGAVPADWLIPEGARGDGVLLFIHGGGNFFTWGSPHRRLVSLLAISARLPVLGLDFRLTPAFPYPAAHEDCFQAYQALLKETKKIVLVGESSGAVLALATMLRAREAGLPQPLLAGFISPMVDYLNPLFSSVPDAFAHPDFVQAVIRIYLDGSTPSNDDCSPLKAGLRGFPPFFILVGEQEILRSEADRLAETARRDNVEVEVCLWPRVWHGWHALAPQLPEATQALKLFGSQIAQKISP